MKTLCPVCGYHEGYETNSMETYLCGRCGALFNYTPFGPRLVMKDARERFPEYERMYLVDAWEDERISDDALVEYGPNQTDYGREK